MRTLTDHTPPSPADQFARIEAALDEITVQIAAAIAIPHGSDRDNARRAALLARLHARQAAWWRVLALTGWNSTTAVPLVFVRAAHRAGSEANGHAQGCDRRHDTRRTLRPVRLLPHRRCQLWVGGGMNRQPRSTVKGSLTAGRVRRVVENDEFAAFSRRIVRAADEFAAFSRRIVRAAGRRVACGDVDDLPELAALSAAVDAAITDAVIGLRSAGYSWTEIATRLSVTRQAAHQRWSSPLAREVA